MTNVGAIGLGLMGKPMARNLLRAGHALTVHNRSQAAVEELVAAGATSARSPQKVAAASEVVFTNLPDSPDVELVTLGEQGIAAGAHAGLVVIDNSTIKPATARHVAAELGKLGVRFLDAPVSGGTVGAQQGTLTIMVGGPQDAFDETLPLLETIGKTVTYIGESGAGQLAKVANQIMASAQQVALAELLILAQKAGADPQKVVAAIRNGAAQCWTLDTKPQRLFAGDRQPGFKAYMMAKDLNIVLDTAREYGVPLPHTAIVGQLYETMLALDMRELDSSGVIGVIEALADTALDVLKPAE